MTTHEQALLALAQAYDREDAAQRGEPDPWNLDDPGDIGAIHMWYRKRLACAQVAAEAFLSALLPEDAAGLVERLRQYEGRQWETTACYNGTRDEAASLIQSQAARIAELEAAVVKLREALQAIRELSGLDHWISGASAAVMSRMADIHQHSDAALKENSHDKG